MNATGSPIEARLNSFVYVFILIFFIAAAVLGLVLFAIQKFKSLTKSKKWIEANKNRETRRSDVHLLALEAGLASEEKMMLYRICRHHHARNIQFLYRSETELNRLFKAEFQLMNSQSPRNEEKTAAFFSLRYKLEKLYDRKHAIISTRSLRNGQPVAVVDEKRTPWNAVVRKNTPDGFYIEIPQKLASSPSRPKPLSRFLVTLPSQTGILYQCIVRAVRYETEPSGKLYLLAAHALTLKIFQKRMAKRKDINNECFFSAVKAAGQDAGKNNAIQQKRHSGKLIDISATGCKISCALPIVKGQSIRVFFVVPGLEENEAQGTIIRTKKNLDETEFMLYIQFTDIDIAVKNDIYAAIYGYL